MEKIGDFLAKKHHKKEKDKKEKKEKKDKKETDKEKGGSGTISKSSIKDKESCGDYILIELIGRGGFGVVYKAIHKDKGNFAAVKKIRLKNMLNQEQLNSLMMEIQLLKRLKHNNIVKYIDHFHKGSNLFIIMEFMEIGSLEHMLKKHGIFPESLVRVYVKQLLEGLNYLHEQGVIHRDIKCANILLATTGSVKLADFGVSSQLSDVKEQSDMSGTPYWMAPEVTRMQGITSSCDIWSLGCTIIELLTGSPPYFELNTAQALYKIVTDDHPPLPEGISKGLEDVLLRCFQKDEKIRVTAKKLLQHPWIKQAPERGSLSEEADMTDVKKEISSYNKQLQEVGNKVKKSAFPSFRSPIPLRQRAMSVATDTIDDHHGSASNFYPKESPKPANHANHANHHANGAPMLPVARKLSFKSGGVLPISLNKSDGNIPNQSEVLQQNGKNSSPLVARLERSKGLSMYQEKDDDFSSGFGDIGETSELKINQVKLQEVHWQEEIEETFDNLDLDKESVMEDKYRDQLQRDIVKLIEDLTKVTEAQAVINTCSQLKQIFKHNPKERVNLITKNGIVPILDQLHRQRSAQPAVAALLQLVNAIIDDSDIQESICLLGGIPVITSNASSEFNVAVRTEVAKIILKICSSSNQSLQMFISCRSFPMMVNLIEPENYEDQKEIIHCCLDSILKIFKLQTHTPKHAFCHIFTQSGLMLRAANALGVIDKINTKPDIQNLFVKLAEIFLLFSHAESSLVKEELCKQTILKKIKHLLGVLIPKDSNNNNVVDNLMRDGLLKMLKVIRNVSSPPNNREAIEQAGLIESLVQYLGVRSGIEKLQEIHNQVLNSLYNMCQLNPKRQEKAAAAGVIPALHATISEEKGPLKEIALSIFFDLVNSSPATRNSLWENQSLKVYSMLLSDPNWYKDAFESLASWLNHDKERLENELQQEEFVQKLRAVFKFSKLVDFSKVLPAFLKLITDSLPLNKAVGTTMIPTILEQIQVITEPHSRVFVLKILRALYTNSPNKMDIWRNYNLGPIIVGLAEKDTSVIVNHMAAQMIHDVDNLSKSAEAEVDEDDKSETSMSESPQ